MGINFLDKVHREILSNYDLKNIHLTNAEFMKILEQILTVKYQYPVNAARVSSGDYWGTLFGLPVFAVRDGFLLWVKCEYCGRTVYPKSRLGYLICERCGAEVC
jgi:hypothetical protein